MYIDFFFNGFLKRFCRVLAPRTQPMVLSRPWSLARGNDVTNRTRKNPTTFRESSFSSFPPKIMSRHHLLDRFSLEARWFQSRASSFSLRRPSTELYSVRNDVCSTFEVFSSSWIGKLSHKPKPWTAAVVCEKGTTNLQLP